MRGLSNQAVTQRATPGLNMTWQVFVDRSESRGSTASGLGGRLGRLASVFTVTSKFVRVAAASAV